MSDNAENSIPESREAYRNAETNQLLASEILVEESNFTPDISKRTRTVAYFAVGIGAAVTGLATGIAAVWVPELADEVATTSVSIMSFLGLIAGIFGVAYRPTKTQ